MRATGLRKKSQDWEQIKNLVTANLVTKSYKKLEKTERERVFSEYIEKLRKNAIIEYYF